MFKFLALAVLCTVVMTATVGAQEAKKGPLIATDGEIDDFFNRHFLEQLYKVAGLRGKAKVHLVIHPAASFAIFSERSVYITSGMVKQLKTPNEMLGLVAHEVGHITLGHLKALRNRITNGPEAEGRDLALTVMIGGLQVGGSLPSKIDPQKEILMRSLLAERRAQESSADQAAIRYLTVAKISSAGLLAVVEGWAQQEYVATAYQDPMPRSHPADTGRLSQLRSLANASPYKDVPDDPELVAKFEAFKRKALSWGTLR